MMRSGPASTVLHRLLRAGLAVILATAGLAVTAAAVPTQAAATGLVGHYVLDETSGTLARDSSGRGRDATVVGGAARNGVDGVRLDGTDDHVDLPDDLMRGLSAITVSVQVRISAAQPSPYFVWGMGNTVNGAGSGYLFTTGNDYRTAISTANWSGERTVSAGAPLARDRWTTLTYTLAGGVAVLYRDGTEVARRTGVTVTPGQIGGGTTTANYLGRSLYTADRYLTGSVRDFRVYDRALPAAEVAALGSTAAAGRVAQDAAALVVVDAADVRGNLTLATTGAHGSAVNWASDRPAVVTPAGVVTRPASGAAPAAVRLTATVTLDGVSATRVFALTVRPRPAPEPMSGYAFAYFTGNSVAGENVHFAASRGNNALQWDELNGGAPTLTSTFGERGLRDPFIVRSPEGDKFFLIATDLSIGRGTTWDASQRQGSRHIEVWESTDLVNWSAQRHVLVSPETAGNTWAPEAFWSAELGSYVVFWASKLYAANDPGHTGSTYNRMLYATTRDFRTFGAPRIWQDFGASRIDSTVIREGSTYHRFTKDEGGVTGCSDVIQERNDSLVEADDRTVPGWNPAAPAWTIVGSCLGRAAGTSAVEGPTAFAANPGDTSGSRYYLFVDEYGGRGYIPLGSASLDNPQWRVPASYALPASPRHGTVVPVTARELAALRQDPAPVTATPAGLIARYPGTAAGATLTDTSGNGHNGTLIGGAAVAGGEVTFDGTDDHVRLPDNLMAGLNSISVAAQVWVDPAQRTPYFLWGLGNTTGGQGNGYLFTTGTAFRASITRGNWAGEQTVSAADVGRGAWHQLTYTLAGGTATLWLDGRQVATRAGVTVTPGAIGNGRTTANSLGRSLYTADRFFQGRMREVSLWNRALTASEIAALAGT